MILEEGQLDDAKVKKLQAKFDSYDKQLRNDLVKKPIKMMSYENNTASVFNLRTERELNYTPGVNELASF